MEKLLVGIGAVAFWSLFGAVILRVVARRIQKVDLLFSKAYKVVVSAGIASELLGFVVCGIVADNTSSRYAANCAVLLMFLVGFLIQSSFVSSELQIPYSRGCLVSLAMLGISIAIILFFAVPLFLVMTFE